MLTNKITLAGYAGNDAETRKLAKDYRLVQFRLAHSRKRHDGDLTTWVNVKVLAHPDHTWKATLLSDAALVGKGDHVIVMGSLEVKPYQDQNGNERLEVTIMADELGFIERRLPSSADGSAKVEREELTLEDLPF